MYVVAQRCMKRPHAMLAATAAALHSTSTSSFQFNLQFFPPYALKVPLCRFPELFTIDILLPFAVQRGHDADHDPYVSPASLIPYTTHSLTTTDQWISPRNLLPSTHINCPISSRSRILHSQASSTNPEETPPHTPSPILQPAGPKGSPTYLPSHANLWYSEYHLPSN